MPGPTGQQRVPVPALQLTLGESLIKWSLGMSCPRETLCGGTGTAAASTQPLQALRPDSCAISAISALVNLALLRVECCVVMAESESKQHRQRKAEVSKDAVAIHIAQPEYL